MKRFYCQIACMFAITALLAVSAWATESKEEKQLRTEASGIDDMAGKGEGEKAVKQRIETEFGVSSSQVQALRDKKMGYGEISIALSLAQKMEGGISDDNIRKVMSMRQGPPIMGWGAIAKQLGAKLGPTVSRVKSVRHTAREDLKHQGRGEKEHKEKAEKAEKKEGRSRESRERETRGGEREMSRGKGK